MASKHDHRKQAAKAKRGSTSTLHDYAATDLSVPRPQRIATGPIEAKTPNQERYIKTIKNKDLTFGIGPAGSGKTYIAGALAAQALQSGEAEQIIITRPAVEAGESLGFLPGELDEKYQPFIAAFMGVLNERLGKSQVEYMLKSGKIIASPLAYMRGLTFKDAFVIMDEAQNATPKQMQLFLTRIGVGAKVVVNGDLDQTDINGPSGLQDAIDRVGFIPSVGVVKFGFQDIVRSGLVQEIVQAYAQPIPGR
jgi:phosphate starvation-inducible protein PhoH and related proteins